MSADNLRPEAREFLDRARDARTPTDGDKDRVYQAMIAGLASGTGASATASAATAKAAGKASLVWLKWAVPAVLVATAAVGTYVVRSSEHTIAPASAAAIEPPSAPATSPAPPAAEPVATRDEPGAPAPKTSTAVKTTDDDLGRDATMLHDALEALNAGNAGRALVLARYHARRFPGSQLRAESSALEVRALCALGRKQEAQKIAAQLRVQAPNSPVSASLGDTCVVK